jgi:outer membrane protein OmpA-like peptidoglycan-associated protein
MNLTARKRSLLAYTLLALWIFTAYAAGQRPSPRVEVFGGYSALYPNATASGLLPGALLPVQSCLCWNPRGVGASVTYDFNRWLGLTVDSSGHWGDGANTTAARLGKFSAYNADIGPTFTWRTRHISPFAEVLVGGDRLTPELFHHDDRFGLLAGVGIDIPVGRHISLRPAQADFVYSNHQFGSQPLVPATDVRGLRVQAGVVFLFGSHERTAPPPPVAVVVPVAAPEPAVVAAAPVVVAAAPAPEPVPPPPPTPVPDPPAPVTAVLGAVPFTHDPARPARVDNEAKAFLDDITLTMQRNFDARLALVGHAAAGEPHPDRLAAQRAVNIKAYLVHDKGIDASRIDVYTSGADSKTVDAILIPLGATLDTTGFTKVNESVVPPHPRNATIKHLH